MKTLMLMRHAKSSHDDLSLTDFDRPLNERGKADVEEMGKRMVKNNVKPAVLISSPAKRAFKTAKHIASSLGINESDICLEYDIYEASIQDLLHVIRNIDDENRSAMLFGHNPAFTGLISYLTHTPIENLPTAGIATIAFPVQTWKQISEKSGELIWLDFPKKPTS
jgi:phosphohistidine phosphatase